MMVKALRIFATLGSFVQLAVALLCCCFDWPSCDSRILAAAPAAADQHEAESVHEESSPPSSTLPRQDGRSSDVLFAVYFIPVENNAKKSLDAYLEWLPQTCSHLEQFGHTVAAVGNHSFVRSIPGCENLEPEGPECAPHDLRHGEAASVPMRNGCQFLRRRTPMDSRVVQIWLNKIELLSDLGDRYPDRRIVLVDASLKTHRRPFVKPMLEHFEGSRHEPDETLTVTTKTPGSIKKGRKKGWGGKSECHDLPPFVGSLLSIRGGEHSHHLRSLYREALQNTSHLALLANSTGEGCPFYCDEYVMTQMYKHDPSQFTLMETLDDGTPGAIRAPGDHPPLLEWQEQSRQKRENGQELWRQKRENEQRLRRQKRENERERKRQKKKRRKRDEL